MKKTKRIYFGASKGKSFISTIIRWVQWGDKHTHIFFMYEPKENPLVIEAWHEPILKGGAVRRGLFFTDEKLHTPHTEFDTYYMDVTEEDYAVFLNFLESKLGMQYDMMGIVGFATHSSKTHSLHKYFCSELMFEALQSIGINLLIDTLPQTVSPSLFVKSPLLHKL